MVRPVVVIAIAVAAGLTDDCELELSVDDKGPGIPTQDRERIFEPFFRGDSVRQSRVPGHGLGLAICQSIVEAHGGRMTIESQVGKGTSVCVILPLVDRMQSKPPGSAHESLTASTPNA